VIGPSPPAEQARLAAARKERIAKAREEFGAMLDEGVARRVDGIAETTFELTDYDAEALHEAARRLRR